MNRNYNRGRAYEYKAKKALELEGWTVIRAAGSHGPYDLIAFKDGQKVLCIQVKATKEAAAIKLLERRFSDQFDENDPQGSFERELWVWHKGSFHVARTFSVAETDRPLDKES